MNEQKSLEYWRKRWELVNTPEENPKPVPQYVLESGNGLIGILEAKLERYEQREAGNEFCEAHEDWLPIEEMHMDSEGTWLCQEAWDELVSDQRVPA